MTSTFHPVLAITLALGMLAAVSAPSHAALSTTDRSASAPVAAASSEALAVAVAPATVSDAAPVTAASAPVTTATAPVQPRKVVAAKPQPRVSQASRNAFASAVVPSAGFARRGSYPCH